MDGSPDFHSYFHQVETLGAPIRCSTASPQTGPESEDLGDRGLEGFGRTYPRLHTLYYDY